MLRAIIIDDEPQSSASLRNDIAMYCPAVQVISMCTSGKEGIIAIKKDNPDLVFLDIEMPWMNGFEMLDILGQIDFKIIFTTAYDQFAAKAFRLSAIDYLLKPIDPVDLQDAIRKAVQNKDEQSELSNIKNLLRNLKEPSTNQKIALANKDGYEFIEFDKIIYCQAEGAYTKVFIEGRKYILVSKTLGDIEELLPSSIFQRIHHSTIVNMNYVTHFLKADGGYVKMQTGEQLVVSKSRKEAILEKLGLK